MFSSFFLLLAFADSSSNVKPALTLQTVPEEHGFLERPGDVAVDENGDIYVLDLEARKIYIWDNKGVFKSAFGKKGQGPGEFMFAAQVGGSQGFISITPKTLYVFDGANRALNRFDREFAFKGSEPIRFFSGGSVENLKAINPDRFLVFYSNYFADVPHRIAAIYDGEAELVKEIAELEEKTWHYYEKGGQRKVMIHGFAPDYRIVYNEANGEVLLLDGGKPGFDVYDLNGVKQRSVEMRITRKPITKADIEEHDSRNIFKDQDFFTASYEDYKAYYDYVLPIGLDRYLVYTQSPVYRNLEGIIVDSEGKTQSKFEFSCGEGGSLRGSRGKVFAMHLDDMDELSIVQLAFDK